MGKFLSVIDNELNGLTPCEAELYRCGFVLGTGGLSAKECNGLFRVFPVGEEPLFTQVFCDIKNRKVYVDTEKVLGKSTNVEKIFDIPDEVLYAGGRIFLNFLDEICEAYL